MTKGYLTLVLHAHLPFVRHPEHEFSLEEDWLFEAITETYIPLLETFGRLDEAGVRCRLTLSISPTLVEMLNDDLLSRRYVRHLEKLIELSEKEIGRTVGQDRFGELAKMYNSIFTRTLDLYKGKYGSGIVPAFKALQDQGCLEIITCPATHPYFPLMALDEPSVHAQMETACRHYEKTFGRRPAGMWLPECGYEPFLDRHIKECGLDYFFMDAHGLLRADPPAEYGSFAPVTTPGGVSVFGRDMESSRQVWSSKVGYPGDPWYRDFYRDIGYDLDAGYLAPYIQPNGERKMTGIKYHRITGGQQDKEPYDRQAGLARAVEHASDFVCRRIDQIIKVSEFMERPPLIVAPYDAELFGHWWHEGPEFLEAVFRKIHFDQDVIEPLSAPDYLEMYMGNQVVNPESSSWGLRGHSEMWLDKSNDWIYPNLHKAGERMGELASKFHDTADPLIIRALNQAARELMLAQSSDWAFIMKTGTMTMYAEERFTGHIGAFTKLYGWLIEGGFDEKFLAELEKKNCLFPDIDFRLYDQEAPGANGR